MLSKNEYIPFALILLMCSIFGIFFMVNSNIAYYIKYLVLFYVGWLGLRVREGGTYRKLIWAFCICVIISCLYSYLFNGQSLFSLFKASYYYLCLLSFFIPFYYKLSIEQTVNLLKVLSIIFCAFYIFQWLVYPVEIFPMATAEWGANDYFYRGRMVGSICGYFLFMYAWNRLIVSKNILYLGLLILAFIPILIQGFRSLIFFTVMASILMPFFIFRRNKLKVVIPLAIIITLGYYAALNVPIVQEKIEEMVSRQESDQTFDNQDYVRNICLAYYYSQFAKEPVQFITGGGIPIEESQASYNRMFEVGNDLGLYWNDLGLIGLALLLGFPAIIIFVWLNIKACKDASPPDYQFIRFTIFIALFGSIITSMEIFRDGNFVFLGLYAYVSYKLKEKSIASNSCEQAQLSA